MRQSPTLALEYALAERLGKTHAELMTGQPQPLDGVELMEWSVFDEVRGEMRDRRQRAAQRQAAAQEKVANWMRR